MDATPIGKTNSPKPTEMSKIIRIIDNISQDSG
jgi:hypothetical protein